MAGLTDVQICNRALILLGQGTINSLSDGTDKANICAELYPGVRDAVLSMHPWRFTIGKKQLSQLTATPLQEWDHAYQLPAELLNGPWAVFDSGQSGARPKQRFEIFEDKLYTDYDTVFIDLQVRQPENQWPPWFVKLVQLALAGEMAKAQTDIASLAQEWNARAWGPPGDNYKGGWFRVAVEQNGRLNPPATIEDFTLIEARFSS